jgi:hypothetical protein
MTKMTPELFSPHWNLVAHVTVVLMIKIQHGFVVGVMENQFHKCFLQSKDRGL